MEKEEEKRDGRNRKTSEMVDKSSRIVFFGGAGVSTESKIPDFRSEDGLYNMKYKYPPETIISHSFFLRNPEEFYRFYKDRMLCLDAEPNPAHRKLAELEQAGNFPRWSPRILTDSIRRRGAGPSMNCMEAFTGITV